MCAIATIDEQSTHRLWPVYTYANKFLSILRVWQCAVPQCRIIHLASHAKLTQRLLFHAIALGVVCLLRIESNSSRFLSHGSHSFAQFSIVTTHSHRHRSYSIKNACMKPKQNSLYVRLRGRLFLCSVVFVVQHCTFPCQYPSAVLIEMWSLWLALLISHYDDFLFYLHIEHRWNMWLEFSVFVMLHT